MLNYRPELLSSFFLLSLHDALTYNKATNEGGPNGSLRFELDAPWNADLQDAVEAIKQIRTLQREDMSYADTFAFAGAVAFEVTGGPRIIVQIGREDASKADPPGKSGLYKADASAADLMEAFDSAGLQPAKDIVLFHGAVGSLSDIAQGRVERARAMRAEDDDEEDEDLELGSGDITYGKVSSRKRGPVLVSSNVALLTLGGQKFSNGYLKALLQDKNRDKLAKRDREILANKEMLAEVQRYAANNTKFVNDTADLFQKVTLLGRLSLGYSVRRKQLATSYFFKVCASLVF